MRVLVLHGPNLNRLGKREPGIYGTVTLADIDARLRALAESLGVGTVHLQSNHEGTLVDALHAADEGVDGIVFNPGAFTHYAWSLRDAVASIRRPVVEVHLSDVQAREAWRRVSVLEDVRLAVIGGRGVDSYLDGLRLVVDHLRKAT
jgi:3-dehydroquinate dehydratase-2